MGWVWLGCTLKPQPIDYGSDGCHFCKMTIVDPQHGAEAVTDKGKVYKFDAIECMLDFIQSEAGGEISFAHLLVNDYLEPGNLLDAFQSVFLIHKGIKSPMGAYLSATATKAGIDEMNKSQEGEIYNWQGLVSKWKQK